MSLHPNQVLLAPVVSEKSYSLITDRKYTFKVHEDAHKTQIRQAVEELFEVKVAAVQQDVAPAPADPAAAPAAPEAMAAPPAAEPVVEPAKVAALANPAVDMPDLVVDPRGLPFQ